MYKDLVGKKFIFEDGDSLEIIQVKWRGDEDYLVSILMQQGPGIPRKLVLPIKEFVGTYGHLFGLSEPPDLPQ